MDEDEEDYLLYGTPLPEIEDEATLKKKASNELQVRDEKGRQRFHGAFTGGFSAGFFNTVGTKEGWAPSAFISSRSKVADRIQQNPEDFMDNEDFGEFGIATRKIHTTSNFQNTSVRSTEKRKFLDTDNVIPGEAPLKDIVQPVRESIGILILKKLGWRPGQGIGPRIKKCSDTKIYGCSPFPDILEENDPMAMAFTFAPEDTEGMSYCSKDDYFGLGYAGLSKESVFGTVADPFTRTTTKSWLAKDKRKIKISGQAFGVGAFEDEDEDIYRKDDMSQYDFSDLTLKGSKDSNNTIDLQKQNLPGIISGFSLASQPPLVKKLYSPPSLPLNFKPMHLKSLIISQNVNPNLTSSRHALSASDRSLLLGEKKFQKFSINAPNIIKPTSNFEAAHNLPSSSTSFKVFPNDVAKQQRYEEYLNLKEKGDLKKFSQPLGFTEWEKQQELEEFAKASVLYKPMSSALSSRFESRSHLSVEHEVMAALEKIKKEKEEKPVVTKKNLVGISNRKTFEWHPVPILCKRMNVPNPYPNSESTGTQSFLKSKSVFQHLAFNIREAETSKTDVLASSSSINLEKEVEVLSKNVSANIQTKVSDGTMPVKSNINVPLENQKPPMDFFKDIFENSSSEDEEVEEEKEPQNNLIDSNRETYPISDETLVEPEASIQKPISVVKRVANNDTDINNSVTTNYTSKKIGFGVFANLDLDALNQRKTAEKNASSDTETKRNEDVTILPKLKDASQNQSEANDLYGPELPPNFSMISEPKMLTNSLIKKKHSKSSHKHKHHKHKHKKKKKKSSKRNSSSGSSEDELEDIPPSLILEKLKKLQRRKS